MSFPSFSEDPSPTLPVDAWGEGKTLLRESTEGEGVKPAEWALVVYAGNALGRLFLLHAGETLLGRSPHLQIPLADDEVSRTHAAFRLLDDEVWVEDLDSTNGTRVNGQPLTRPGRLSAGDRIACGRHVLKLVAMDPLEHAFHQTLLDQSTRDALTGLGNRGAILAELHQRFDLSLRHGRPLSLAMMDLDHFKAINDRFGHGVGDLALQHVAEQVRQQLRSSDLAGRIGGEEFLLVLPETDHGGALLVLKRLRDVLNQHPLPSPSGPIPVTASFGVAERGDADRDAGCLLSRADAALYAAKHRGRNRIESAETL